MENSTNQNAVLGYHKLGDYFYFTILSEGNHFLGQSSNDAYKDLESFAGLVTAVHEHYHLMQELFQGFFWWYQSTRDLLVVYISEALKNNPRMPIDYPLWKKPPQTPPNFVTYNEPVSLAQRQVYELDTIGKYFHSKELTQKLLLGELHYSPELGQFITDDHMNLTTMDLIECQAALLTELYITKLSIDRPTQFDLGVMRNLKPLFRVDLMEDTYCRPLRALVHILNTMGIKTQIDNTNAHPLYRQITYGTLYVLLAFLLDYALHLPPDPIDLLTESPDAACQQDIYPPFRFINMAFLYALELQSNRSNLRNSFLNEKYLYTAGDQALATMINRMHASVRRQSIFGRKPKDTFFSLEKTTQMWETKIQIHPIQNLHQSLHTLFINCIHLRKQHPDYWLNLQPLDFDTAVGLPRIFITNQGLGALPYLRTEEKLDTDQLREYLTKAMTLHYEGLLSESPNSDEMRKYPDTLVPFKFIEAWMAREMSYRFSSLVLYGESLRCPMTQSIGRFIPCKSRTPACESFHQLSLMPNNNCLFLQTIQSNFCEPSVLRKKEW